MEVMLPHWAYTAAWAFWAAWFGVWETLAILDQGENETLSGHIKRVMYVDGKPTVGAFIVGAILIWLVFHFYQEVRTQWTT